MLRFLADEGCDFAVVRALRSAGFDVLAIAEVAPRADDSDIIDLAAGESRVLLTEDKDFGQLVYAELRRIATRQLRNERAGHTLQPTALVNEAFIRLINVREVQWQNRAHFMAMAARLMRRVLVEAARARRAAKRGSGDRAGGIETIEIPDVAPGADVEALNDALDALAAIDARKGQVVEMRFFGGLSVEETAEVLGVSTDTVTRDWKFAKVWLLRELSGK